MADRDRIKRVFTLSKHTEPDIVTLHAATGCGMPAKDIDHIKEKILQTNVRGSRDRARGR